MRERFEKGAVERGLQAKKATKIFDLMEYFAGYGFNKSHSTTYALLAYQTAYLKANYPPHFMAALLTIESQNTEKLAFYLGECRDLGVTGAAAGRQRQRARSSRSEPGRRRPLRPRRDQERRRGRDPVDARPRARRSGAIRALDALCEDVDLRLVNKRVLESLVKAGRARLARTPRDAAWAAQPVDRAPRPALRRDRSRARAGQPPPGRSRAGAVAACSAATPATTTTSLPALACRPPCRGPRRRCCAARRKRSASI